MLQDYLGYAGLITYLSLSVIVAVQISKFMNDGEIDSGLGSLRTRGRVLVFLSLLVGCVVGFFVFIAMLLLGLCGIDNQTLDYLAIPIYLVVFGGFYVAAKLVGKIMAA